MTRFNDGEPESAEKSGWQSKLDKLQSFSRYSNDEIAVEAVKVDPGKRLVAFIIDTAVGYGLGVAVTTAGHLAPAGKDFFRADLILMVYLLIKDAFFQGRGVGKNLMGLQVVDLKTAQPADLAASIKRNMVIFGPIIVIGFVSGALKLIPGAFIDQYIPGFTSLINQTTLGIMGALGSGYTMIVIPYEVYRACSRDDGMRWGDQFAGTTIVEAPMDFSSPLPGKKKSR